MMQASYGLSFVSFWSLDSYSKLISLLGKFSSLQLLEQVPHFLADCLQGVPFKPQSPLHFLPHGHLTSFCGIGNSFLQSEQKNFSPPEWLSPSVRIHMTKSGPLKKPIFFRLTQLSIDMGC